MTPLPLFSEYQALWRRITEDRVFVRYGGTTRGESGYFDHVLVPIDLPDGTDGWGPVIVICRESHTMPANVASDHRSDGRDVDLQGELCTLAHEYGHCRSFRGGSPKEVWEAYLRAALHRNEIVDGMPDRASIPEALGGGLAEGEKALIVEEETLAWELGRPFVPEHMLADYDDRALRGARYHRFRMGMEERWPGDAVD